MKFWTQQGGGAHCLTLRDQLQNYRRAHLSQEMPSSRVYPIITAVVHAPLSLGWRQLPTLIPSSEGCVMRL